MNYLKAQDSDTAQTEISKLTSSYLDNYYQSQHVFIQIPFSFYLTFSSSSFFSPSLSPLFLLFHPNLYDIALTVSHMMNFKFNEKPKHVSRPWSVSQRGEGQHEAWNVWLSRSSWSWTYLISSVKNWVKTRNFMTRFIHHSTNFLCTHDSPWIPYGLYREHIVKTGDQKHPKYDFLNTKIEHVKN